MVERIFEVNEVGEFRIVRVDYLRQGQENPITSQQFAQAMNLESPVFIANEKPVIVVFNDAVPCAWASVMVFQALSHYGRASMVALDTREGGPNSCIVLVSNTARWKVGDRIANPDPDSNHRHTGVAESGRQVGGRRH